MLSESNHFFFNDTATTEIYTLSLHDALPIYLADLFPHQLSYNRFVEVESRLSVQMMLFFPSTVLLLRVYGFIYIIIIFYFVSCPLSIEIFILLIYPPLSTT